ncbi:MAG: hypothetical protein Q8873_06905 [Bacillota bacterium]|nr:hypothetical protein [Bacillota bacterium]
MKKILSHSLLVILCVSLFTFTVSAKVVSTGLTVNGDTVSLSTHIEYANQMYYLSTKELTSFNFTVSKNAKEYILTRYNKELRIEKDSSTVYSNGVESTFENAVILASEQNGAFYVSADLIGTVFCSSYDANASDISFTLANFTKNTTKNISGTITLASGTAANDMEFLITAVGNDTYSTQATISAGSGSASYSLPIYSTDTNFVLSCKQLNASAVTGYSPLSYYSYDGTVTEANAASSIAPGTSTTVNFNISPSVTISGNVNGSGNGYLIITNDEGNIVGSTDFYASSSSPYSLTIPGNTENAFIRYKIYSGSGDIQYGYFNGTSSATAFENEATPLDLSFDQVFNMNILTGHTISGSLTWNNANVSSCKIKAVTADGKYITDTNVYTSSDSSFSITVPYDNYTDYVLMITTDDSTFAKYVTAGGLTTSLSEATVYSVASADVTNAAITIDGTSADRMIYGTVSLPDGLVATTDIPVTIYAGTLTKNEIMVASAYSIANEYSTNVTILTGTKSVDYSIDLGDSYEGTAIALAYKAGGASVTNGYFDGKSSTIFSTEKDISFDATKINNINLYVVTNSPIDITSIKDTGNNDYTLSASEPKTIVLSLKNLTNIDKNGTIFIGAYDNVNALVASGNATYSVDGSSNNTVTISMVGNISNAKFLKVLTLDSNKNLISRDIMIF